jgi:hypothetical protein
MGIKKMFGLFLMVTFVFAGSHNSFSYALDPASELGPDGNNTLQQISHNPLIGSIVKKVAFNWSVTQSLTFKEQLQAGIRYFDLRSAKRKKDNEYYFLHGLFGPKIADSMTEVNEYLAEHPKEIIILDFNHFYEMEYTDHEIVLSILMSIFGEKICFRQTGVSDLSLRLLWEKHQQVIIIYHQEDIVTHYHQLWPGGAVVSPWPNTMDTHKLIGFLTTGYTSVRSDEAFYVFQGVMTPDDGTVFKHLVQGSIKKNCAEKFNQTFVDWLRERNIGRNGINICLLDFFEIVDFVKSVISLNIKHKVTAN